MKLGKRYRIVLTGKLTSVSESVREEVISSSLDLSDITVESVTRTDSKFADMLEGEDVE